MRIPAVNSSLVAAAFRTRWHQVALASAGLRTWLTAEGSLTRRLKQASTRFRVIRLAQGRGRAGVDEVVCIRPAGSPAGARDRGFLVREVLLECDGSPVVFAHSVIDARALRGRWRWLAGLGNQPLGEALFSDPLVRRGPLAYRRLRAPDPRFRRAAAALALRGQPVPTALWARRSVFSAGGHRLLVTEVFLPAVASLSPVGSVDSAPSRTVWHLPTSNESEHGR